MITRVLLRNWRGYEKLGLDLGPGLTFVIADNGVGKTSLIDGVSWAIFGSASGVDAEASIRVGAAGASAEVDLVVGDATITVSRSLAREGRDRQSLTVERDGIAVDPGDLRGILTDATALPHEILPPVMFVPEMQLTHEGELFADVQDHLASLLGIDSLRKAAKTAHEVAGQAAKQIRAAREVVRQDEAVIESCRRLRSELAAEIAQLDSSLALATDWRDSLDVALAQIHEWNRYDEQLVHHHRCLDELADQARAVGIATDLEEAARADEDLTHQSEALGVAKAEAAAERSVVLGLIEQLSTTDAVCPVCLRAVDDNIARHAAEAHRARLAEIEELYATAERRHREVAAAAKKTRAIATALAGLRPPAPPKAPRPDPVEADVVAERAALAEMIAEQLRNKGALEEQLRQTERTLSDADSYDDALSELTRLHAVAAAATSLAQLATAEADARTERSLVPLSRTLAARWAEFFVASPAAPRLSGVGHIELDQGETATIAYPSFSGGEKTLASLLTRLLFVTAATELRSMWLDEPLEHLDPTNRTRVARLLAQVTRRGSHMRQVIVTTYEEGLARSMTRRHDPTNTVYVSTDELL